MWLLPGKMRSEVQNNLHLGGVEFDKDLDMLLRALETGDPLEKSL